MEEKRKIILFIATSLDGFIATEDGDLGWLFAVEGEDDNGFGAFYETIDTIVLGRKTYDDVLRMTKGEYPHRDRINYVFSSEENEDDENVHFVKEEIVHFAERLKSESGKDIWFVGGSSLLASFMANGLIDEFIITVAPVLLGKGIPLFGGDFHKLKLELLKTTRMGQFVQNHYIMADKP